MNEFSYFLSTSDRSLKDQTNYIEEHSFSCTLHMSLFKNFIPPFNLYLQRYQVKRLLSGSFTKLHIFFIKLVHIINSFHTWCFWCRYTYSSTAFQTVLLTRFFFNFFLWKKISQKNCFIIKKAWHVRPQWDNLKKSYLHTHVSFLYTFLVTFSQP